MRRPFLNIVMTAFCAAVGNTTLALENPALHSMPSCGEAWQDTRLTESERLELIVDLAHDSIESRHPGLRLSGPQHAVLGLVIDEACRQSPEAGLDATVELAVRVAFDAQPAPAAALVAR